jgi:hypothetical protein
MSNGGRNPGRAAPKTRRRPGFRPPPQPSRRFPAASTGGLHPGYRCSKLTKPTGFQNLGAVMGNNPSSFKGDDLPVENVSWDDAMAYIATLNEKTGKGYRLPTEAEWEYACRGGATNTKTPQRYCGGNDLDGLGWYEKNADGKTHPVGSKGANLAGLHDMSGNVLEWVSDWYGDYPASSRLALENPQGPGSGAARVLRGGPWFPRRQGLPLGETLHVPAGLRQPAHRLPSRPRSISRQARWEAGPSTVCRMPSREQASARRGAGTAGGHGGSLVPTLQRSSLYTSLHDAPKGPKARNIPAWGSAPGSGKPGSKGLKARPIGPWDVGEPVGVCAGLDGAGFQPSRLCPLYLGRCPRLVWKRAVGAVQTY